MHAREARVRNFWGFSGRVGCLCAILTQLNADCIGIVECYTTLESLSIEQDININSLMRSYKTVVAVTITQNWRCTILFFETDIDNFLLLKTDTDTNNR